MNRSLFDKWESQKKGLQKQYSNFLKRNSKKNLKKLSALAHEKHQKVFQEVDCLDCANCCTSIPPIVTKSDVARIAKYLGISKLEFENTYLTYDEDGDAVFRFTPCVFLMEDNKCSIYEYRPKACREYPHTDGFEFVENLKLHKSNILYCPATFHIVQEMLSFASGSNKT